MKSVKTNIENAQVDLSGSSLITQGSAPAPRAAPSPVHAHHSFGIEKID